MISDMKRLCRAAKGALEREDAVPAGYLGPRTYVTEAIVRAVLTELRDNMPSGAYEAGAAHARRWREIGDPSGDTLDLEGCYREAIDHILAEPATN